MAAVKKQIFDYSAAAKKTRETRAKQELTAVKSVPQPIEELKEEPKKPALATSARPVSPDNEYTEQVGIRVSKAMKKYLKQAALDNDTTVNEIIRDLLSRAMRGEISIV